MNFNNPDKILRIGLIVAGALVIIVGGIYAALNYVATPSLSELPLPVLTTPSPAPTESAATATLVALATPKPTATPTETAVPTEPAVTPTPALPEGGIIYALSPDLNSVGWVQAGESGNHFSESFLYTGLRDGSLQHGAMQFDLSFIPNGSTIFLAELELTGLSGEGLTDASSFTVNILTEDIDADWSRHDFEAIDSAAIDETLSPVFHATDLGEGLVNKVVFNAAQRSIIEQRLESNLISFRLDSLTPDLAGWFAWDSGYGQQTNGQGPVLRLGVLPSQATEEAATGEVAEVITSPTATPTFVFITTTPEPENILTAAAVAPALTLQATTTGTPTPLPANWVTPWVVTETPTPLSTATALYQQAEATAVVIAFGTSTPGPPMFTATATPTATPTPIFILLQGELPEATPMAVPTIIPDFIPSELIGKIAFKSDRTGLEEYYVINPDGSGLAQLTNCWAYALAEQADNYSSDGRYRVFTKDVIRYENVDDLATGQKVGVVRADAPGLYWYDALYKIEKQLSEFGAGIAYGGVWSPTREEIAFISTESKNDEIWVTNLDSTGLKQLTRDEYAWWDKHPSWSPDGKQIVFWSNRTGHGQIFVMNADGGELYSLSRTGFNDTDPVWIKYPGIPLYNPDSEDGKPNYVGSFGYCRGGDEMNCLAFQTQPQAQSFYTASGGPLLDPYGLDANGDGKACESLPIAVSSSP